jgi:hypothetical protein
VTLLHLHRRVSLHVAIVRTHARQGLTGHMRASRGAFIQVYDHGQAVLAHLCTTITIDQLPKMHQPASQSRSSALAVSVASESRMVGSLVRTVVMFVRKPTV